MTMRYKLSQPTPTTLDAGRAVWKEGGGNGWRVHERCPFLDGRIFQSEGLELTDVDGPEVSSQVSAPRPAACMANVGCRAGKIGAARVFVI
jgi:hypothetical protein